MRRSLVVAYTSRNRSCRFVGQVGGAHLTRGVADVERGLDARPAALGQPLVGRQQVAANAITDRCVADGSGQGGEIAREKVWFTFATLDGWETYVKKFAGRAEYNYIKH